MTGTRPQIVGMHRSRKNIGEASDEVPPSDLTPPDASSPHELARLLVGIEETSYTWDVANDRLEWQANAATVLGLGGAVAPQTGVALQAHFTPEHTTRWHDAILGSTASMDVAERGVPYRVQFRFLPDISNPRAAFWIEDTGRWWPGPDGRAARARGVVRIVTESYLETQRLLHKDDETDGEPTLAEALAAAMARTEATRQPGTFLIVAIDKLAELNERFGFDIGNEVIAVVGRLLKSKLRRGDVLTRYSSNKFGIIIFDCPSSSIRYSAERLVDAIRNARIETSACQLTATITVGAASIPAHAKTAAEAMSVALEALSHAKEDPSHIAVYQERSALRTERQRNIAIADTVMKALAEGRMRFLLQPIVDARTGQAVLHECLLRIVRPDGTLVSAGEFIEAAEEMGLARAIDHYTLEMAIGLLRAHPGLSLSLNVSGLTASDNDWTVALHRLTADDHGLAQRLTIEITETAVVKDIERIASFVDVLREQGCAVAIDDFGAGYTSFRHLKRLRLNLLKLDGSFVKDLPADPQSRIFVKSMVEIARSYGMKTVAEWVRTEDAAQFLRDVGVDYLQGFLFGEPGSPEVILART